MTTAIFVCQHCRQQQAVEFTECTDAGMTEAERQRENQVRASRLLAIKYKWSRYLGELWCNICMLMIRQEDYY